MSEQDPKKWLSSSLGALGNLFSDGPVDEEEEEKKPVGPALKGLVGDVPQWKQPKASFKKVTPPSQVHPLPFSFLF